MQRFNSELKCRSSWSVLCVFSQCHWSVVSSEAVTGQSGNLYWCFYFVIVCIDWNRCSDTTLSADWRNFIGHKLKSGFRGTVLLDHSTASPAWGPVYWLTDWLIDSSGWSLGWLIDRWDSNWSLSGYRLRNCKSPNRAKDVLCSVTRIRADLQRWGWLVFSGESRKLARWIKILLQRCFRVKEPHRSSAVCCSSWSRDQTEPDCLVFTLSAARVLKHSCWDVFYLFIFPIGVSPDLIITRTFQRCRFKNVTDLSHVISCSSNHHRPEAARCFYTASSLDESSLKTHLDAGGQVVSRHLWFW